MAGPFDDLIPAGALAPEGEVGKELYGQIKGKLAAAKSLRSQLDETEKLYNKDFKGTGIRQSLSEYIPSQKTSRFNAAAAGLTLLGRQAFRVPGAGAESDRELGLLLKAIEPSNTAFDAGNEQRMKQLRRMIGDVEKNYGPIVGQPAPAPTPDVELDDLIAEYQRRKGGK